MQSESNHTDCFDEFLEPFKILQKMKVSNFQVKMIQFDYIYERKNSSYQDLVDGIQAFTDSLRLIPTLETSASQVESMDNHSNSNLNTQEGLSTQAIRLKKRLHLNRSRKTKIKREELQKIMKGYWTKNFLPVGKNPHLQWLHKKMGSEYFKSNLDIQAIRSKVGITLEDYLELYARPELNEVWDEFFEKKLLYREVMLSRAQHKSKMVYIKFLSRFEEAYRTGVFDHIA